MGAVLFPRQLFSATDSWSDAIQQVCGDYTTTCDGDEPFFGEIELRAIDGLGVAYIASNAQAITRSRAQASVSNDEALFLIGCVSGSVQMRQQREDFRLDAGDLALIDPGMSSDFLLAGPCRFLSIGVSRRMLATRLGASMPRSAARIGGTGVGMVLMSLLTSTYAQAIQLSEADARAAEESLLMMLERALLPEKEPAFMADRSNIELYGLQQLILTLLADPQLCSEGIAQHYRTSVRRLHRLFESADLSLSAWIRRARLERCRRDLANPRLAEQSITSIAYKWGFSEASHFSRAFRAQFSMTPKEYRKSSLEATRSPGEHASDP